MKSQTVPWTIPSKELVSLKEALTAFASQRKVTRLQRAAIQRICLEAKRAVVAPEQFFVLFKQTVQTALLELHVALGYDRDHLTTRLMSVCIEEFYQGDCGAEVPPAKDRITLAANRAAVARSSVKRDDECRGSR